MGATAHRHRSANDTRPLLLTGGAAGAAALGILVSTKSGFAGPELALIGLFLLVPAWMATTRHTTWAFAVLILYMGLVDGILKLKADTELPTAGRDVLLYAVLAGLAARALARGDRVVLPAFTGWALAWTVLVVAQVFNPGTESWSHGVVSLRQHIEFVPLLFVGYFVMRSHRRVEGFLALLLAVAAVNGVVGIYQSGLSPEQLASWGPGYARLLDPKTGAPRTTEDANGELRVRPPGLGSDMGFAGVLGATAIPGGIALLLLRRFRRPHEMGLLILGLLGAGAAVLTSQSRSALLTSLVCLLAFVGLLTLSGQAGRTLVALVVVGATAVGAVWAVGSYDQETFYRYNSIAPDRVLDTTVQSRKDTWSLVPTYIEKVPLGAGIGRVGPAGALGTQPITYNAESQFTFLVVELGLAGLLLFLAFQAALCRAVVRGMRRLGESRTAVLMAGVCAPLFGFAVNWVIGVNTTSTPNAPYLWLSVGLIGWWLVARPRRQATGVDVSAEA